MDLSGLGIWGQLSPWGVITIFVMFIGLGFLVPLRTHLRIVRDKDALIGKLEQALDKRDEQFERLFDQTKLIVTLVEDLKKAAAEQRSRTGSV